MSRRKIWNMEGDIVMIKKPSDLFRWLFSFIILLQFATACYGLNQTTVSPDDTLTRADFEFLEIGMSYDEIVARVGPADREVGSGLHIFVYDLDDGSQMTLSFMTLEELFSAVIVQPDGEHEIVIEKDG
jgi:hypothetical protein